VFFKYIIYFQKFNDQNLNKFIIRGKHVGGVAEYSWKITIYIYSVLLYAITCIYDILSMWLCILIDPVPYANFQYITETRQTVDITFSVVYTSTDYLLAITYILSICAAYSSHFKITFMFFISSGLEHHII